MRTVVAALLLCACVLWATLNKHRLPDAWKDLEKSVSSFVGGSNSNSSGSLDEDQAARPAEQTAEANMEAQGQTVLLSSLPPAPRTLASPEMPPVATTAPALPAYLPADHFYARERLLETTATGLTAIPTGKLVRKISEKRGIYLVEDVETGTRLRIEPWKLTREVKQVEGGER